MKKLTKAQQVALLKIYNRPIESECPTCKGRWKRPRLESYLRFRRTAYNDTIMNCVMVPWAGMWLGIEPDGYTHS